jgi:hypothetical protein
MLDHLLTEVKGIPIECTGSQHMPVNFRRKTSIPSYIIGQHKGQRSCEAGTRFTRALRNSYFQQQTAAATKNM